MPASQVRTLMRQDRVQLMVVQAPQRARAEDDAPPARQAVDSRAVILKPAWHRDHETMIRELQREIAEQLPGTGYLELFWSGENGRRGQSRYRLGSPPDDLARSERDLTPADIRLGPADLETLDALITTGTAASRAEPSAGSWPASANGRPTRGLSERARELDQLKAHFCLRKREAPLQRQVRQR
jgi:hypothetical protein